MKIIENLLRSFSPQALTTKRIAFAFAVAALTDAVQLGLGPFGWLFVDDVFDILAMILISRALGFHMLLLPSFVIKLIPGPDMLPTWTGCTAAVIMLRKRAQQKPPIDVNSQVIPVPPVQLNPPRASTESAITTTPPKIS